MATNALNVTNTAETMNVLAGAVVDEAVLVITALASEGTTAVDQTALKAAIDAILEVDLYA